MLAPPVVAGSSRVPAHAHALRAATDRPARMQCSTNEAKNLLRKFRCYEPCYFSRTKATSLYIMHCWAMSDSWRS